MDRLQVRGAQKGRVAVIHTPYKKKRTSQRHTRDEVILSGYPSTFFFSVPNLSPTGAVRCRRPSMCYTSAPRGGPSFARGKKGEANKLLSRHSLLLPWYPVFFFCSSLSITFAVQFFCCTVTKGQQIRRGVGTNRTHPRTFFRPMHGSMYAGRDLHRRLCARKIYWQGGKAKAIRFVRPLPSIAVFYYKISSHKTGRAAAHNCCRVNRHRGTISTLLLYCCRILRE